MVQALGTCAENGRRTKKVKHFTLKKEGTIGKNSIKNIKKLVGVPACFESDCLNIFLIKLFIKLYCRMWLQVLIKATLKVAFKQNY